MEEKINRVKAGSAVYVRDETRHPATDALFTPDTGVIHTVIDKEGTEKITDVALVELSTGVWEVTDQTATDWVKGMYTVIYEATHLGKVSIREDKNAFELY